MTGRHENQRISTFKEVLDGKTDVASNLAEQTRRDISACVKRHRRLPAVRVAKLYVRSALANQGEAAALEERYNLSWLEDRQIAQGSGDGNILDGDEFGFELGLAIFEQHRNHLAQIRLEFFHVLALAVRTRPARDVTHEKVRFRIPLNDDAVALFHDREFSWLDRS